MSKVCGMMYSLNSWFYRVSGTPVFTAGTFASDVDGLAFFRATKDKGEYAKNPARYERLAINDWTGKDEY
jgi:hypothetical protein